MRSFLQFLNEDRKQKTLDWLKANTHQKIDTTTDVNRDEALSPYKLNTHDDSMWDAVKDHYLDDPEELPLHHHVINHLAAMDPSPDAAHTQQIHKWWVNRDFRHEDSGRVTQALRTFSDNKKKLGNTTTASGKKGSDIGAYDSFHDLEDHLNSTFMDQKPLKKTKAFSLIPTL